MRLMSIVSIACGVASLTHGVLALPLMAVAITVPAQGGGASRAKTVDDRHAIVGTVGACRSRAHQGRQSSSFKKVNGHGRRPRRLVVDQKLPAQMRNLESRINSQRAQRDQTQIDFARAQGPCSRGIARQSQLDQARATLDVAERTLQAGLQLRGDRAASGRRR